jgi:hypothetical protein
MIDIDCIIYNDNDEIFLYIILISYVSNYVFILPVLQDKWYDENLRQFFMLTFELTIIICYIIQYDSYFSFQVAKLIGRCRYYFRYRHIM